MKDPKAIGRPACPTCGLPMIFVMVEQLEESSETKHTFHCPECNRSETVFAKIE